MGENIKLKDLYGKEQFYNNIDIVKIPKAYGSSETADFFALSKLQSKSYNFTQNGEVIISPDNNYLGLSQVNINIAVEGTGGGDLGINDVALCAISGSFSSDLVPQVSSYAFYGNSMITEINFPNCSKIDEHAFAKCSGMSKITTSWGDSQKARALGDYAFIGCTSLKSSPTIGAMGNYIYEDCTSLENAFLYCSDAGYYAATYDEGKMMFYNCHSLKSVKFINGSTIMEDGSLKIASTQFSQAFYGCSALTTAPSFTISKVGSNELWSTMPYGIFENCISLQSITACCGGTASDFFGEKNHVGERAFMNCQSMSVATIWLRPIGYSGSESAYFTVGSSAFQSCSSLMSLYLKIPPEWTGALTPTLGGSVFYGTPIASSGITGAFGSIFVPSRLVNTFRNRWSSVASRIVADNT